MKCALLIVCVYHLSSMFGTLKLHKVIAQQVPEVSMFAYNYLWTFIGIACHKYVSSILIAFRTSEKLPLKMRKTKKFIKHKTGVKIYCFNLLFCNAG